MSLINDALKRASQPQKLNPNMPKLLSAHEPPKQSSGKGIFVLLLLAGLGAAGWFGWGYYKKTSTTDAAPNPPAGAPAKTNTTTAAAATPAPAPAAAVAPAPPESRTNSNPIARAAATLQKWADRSSDQETKPTPAPTKPATAVAAAPQGKPASAIPGMPKVQAIFYRPTDATAIIAGETVKKGDEIGGAKVIEIKRQSVRMLLNGEMHDVTIK